MSDASSAKKEEKAVRQKSRRVKRLYQESGGDLNSDIRHSVFYHDFFEDYSEKYVKDEKTGKKKIQRTYIGNYYCAGEEKEKWIGRKVIYILLYAAALALFIFGFSRDVPGGRLWLGVIPTVLTLFVLLYLFASLVIFTTRSSKMTIYEYKTGPKRFKTLTLVAACALFASFLANGVAAAIAQTGNLKTIILSLLSYLGAAVLTLGLYFMERVHHYEIKENENGQDTEKEMVIY